MLSELRKRSPAQAVVDWFGTVPSEDLFVSVMVVGEIRLGVEKVMPRDPERGARLESWLESLKASFGERVLPVTAPIAETWGRLRAPQPLAEVDSLIAATALVHGMTIVSRDTSTADRAEVPWFDPWTGLRG